jgi:hypothetical protein
MFLAALIKLDRFENQHPEKINPFRRTDYFNFILIMFFLVSCQAARTVYVPVHDSHVVTVTQHDTIVNTRLELIRDSIRAGDTISELSNKYASSLAMWSRGYLTHTLKMKDVAIPVHVLYQKIIQTDTITKVLPIVGKSLITNKLNWYQKISEWAFSLILAAFAGILLYKFLRSPLLRVFRTFI